MIVMIIFSLFSILSLGAPDKSLIGAIPTINLPFVAVKVHFLSFIIFGPLVLIAITIYLHVFIGHHKSICIDNAHTHLPFIFNLKMRTARVVSGVLFYYLTPFTLFLFSL